VRARPFKNAQGRAEEARKRDFIEYFMPEQEKQYHRDGLPVNKERPPYSGDLKFEDALGYLTQVAFENKDAEPIVVSLFGTDNIAKAKFTTELIQKVWDKDPEHKVSAYGIKGGSTEQFTKCGKFKKEYPDIKFPMLIWETATNAPPDGESAVYLKRFPDMLIYMYDPKQGKRWNRQAILTHFLEVRKKIAEKLGLPYKEPEFLIVQSPEAVAK